MPAPRAQIYEGTCPNLYGASSQCEVFLGQTTGSLSHRLEPWETLGGPPGSSPLAPPRGQGQLGHQGRGRDSPDAALAGEASGGFRCPGRAPRPILTLVNTILHRARGEGGGALTRGAEAAAPHLDEAISGDRWLRLALRPLGTPK